MTKAMLVVTAVFAIVAVLTWVAFLRPVPVLTTSAVVRDKTHKAAGTYWQQQVGTGRGFRTATPIPMAESYVLELRSDELGVTGFYAVAPSEETRYHVGDTVSMEYQRRGLPLIGHRTVVLSARPR